ncbi:MAG TPA: hypothetical protein VJ160_08070 [Anaerolineales bacterium]|nr:hypothetical protein [Anaerolineales bacterium]
MAGQVVEMDYAVIQSTAKGFRGQSDIALAIGKAGVALFTGLEAGSMWFPPMKAYYGRCKRAVDKKSKELSKTLLEFADDLELAVKDHKTGDFEGKKYFGPK